MAVPAPSVKPLQVGGGVAHYFYRGELGTTGPTLIIDLTDIPVWLREDRDFREQLYVTIQALQASDAITVYPDTLEVLPAAPATPEYLQLDAQAAVAAGLVQIVVETHHSIGR